MASQPGLDAEALQALQQRLEPIYTELVAAFALPDQKSQLPGGWTVARTGVGQDKSWLLERTDENGEMDTSFTFNFSGKKIRNARGRPRYALMEAIVHTAPMHMKANPPKPFAETMEAIMDWARKIQNHVDVWNEQIQHYELQDSEEPLGYDPKENTAMLSFIPEQRDVVDTNQLSKQEYFQYRDALKYDPDGHKHNQKIDVLSSAVVFISDVVDGKRTRSRPAAMYSRKYIRTATEGCHAGFKTIPRIINAQYGYGAIQIDNFCQSSTGKYTPPYASMVFSGRLIDSLRYAELTAEEYAKTLRKFGQADFGLYGNRVEGGLECSDAKHVRFVAASSAFRFTTNKAMMEEQIADGIPDARKCHDLTIANCTPQGAPFVMIDMFFPSFAYVERSFGSFQATLTNAHGDPYADLRKFVRHAQVITGLSSMRSVADTQFTNPDAAVTHYEDIRELNTRHSYAIRDEIAYVDGKLALLERKPGHMITIAIPGTKVHNTQGSWLAVLEGFDPSLIPKIGEIFHVRLPEDIEFEQPTIPAQMKKNDKDNAIVDKICAAFTLATFSAPNDRALFHSLVRQAVEPVVKAAPAGGDIARNAFIDDLVHRIMPPFPQGGDPRPCMSPDYTNEKMDASAIVKIRVKSRLIENEDIYKNLRAPSRILTTCPDMMAVRIAAEGWTESLGDFQALVLAPRAPNAPIKNGRRPIVKVKLNSLPLTTTKAQDVETALKRHSKRCSIVVHLIRSSHDGNLKACFQALSKFCEDPMDKKPSAFHAMARHWATGTGPTIQQDTSKVFTALAEILRHDDDGTVPDDPIMKNLLAKFHELNTDQRAAFRYTKDLPFGTGIVSGCPGSGKTWLMILMVMTLVSGKIDKTVMDSYVHGTVPLPMDDAAEDLAAVTESLEAFEAKEPADYVNHIRPPRETKDTDVEDTAAQEQQEEDNAVNAYDWAATADTWPNDAPAQWPADYSLDASQTNNGWNDPPPQTSNEWDSVPQTNSGWNDPPPQTSNEWDPVPPQADNEWSTPQEENNDDGAVDLHDAANNIPDSHDTTNDIPNIPDIHDTTNDIPDIPNIHYTTNDIPDILDIHDTSDDTVTDNTWSAAPCCIQFADGTWALTSPADISLPPSRSPTPDSPTRSPELTDGQSNVAEPVPADDDSNVAEPVPADDDSNVAEPVPADNDSSVAEPVPAHNDSSVAEPVPADDNTFRPDSPTRSPGPSHSQSNVDELVPAEDNTFGNFVLDAPPSKPMTGSWDSVPQAAPTTAKEGQEFIDVGTIAIIAPTNYILDEIAERIYDLHASIAPGELGFIPDHRILRPQMPEAADKDVIRGLETPDEKTTYTRFDEQDEEAIMDADVSLQFLGEQLFADEKLLNPRKTGGRFSTSHHVVTRIRHASEGDKQAIAVTTLFEERSRTIDLIEEGAEKSKWVLEDGPKRLRTALSALKRDVVESAKFIIATPEVFQKIVNQDLPDLNIHAVWIDEAFRMTEPEILIGMAGSSTAALRMMTGDKAQTRPIVLSEGAHMDKDISKVFAAQFSAQLARSGASRKVDGGYPTHYLSINHRAEGGVSIWPSQMFYNWLMREAKSITDWSPEQARTRKLLASLVHQEHCGPQVICNMPGGAEMADGTSWKNHSEAKLILRIVLWLHENLLCREFPTADEPGKRIRILIITPYDAQVKLINSYIAKIPACHVARGTLKNLVPQAGQGLGAEIVIAGATRDVSPGYIGQSELINVTHTRAIWGVIQLASDAMWGKKGKIHPRHPAIANMVRLYGYVESYGGVTDIPESWFSKPVSDLYTYRCTMCPGSRHNHNTVDCKVAKGSPMPEGVPAGTEIPDEFTKLIDNTNQQGSSGKNKARETLREMYGLEDVTYDSAPVKSGDQKALERGHLGKTAAMAYQKHREEHRSAFMRSATEEDRNKYTYPAPDFAGEEEVVVSDAVVRDADPEVEKEPEHDEEESDNDSLAGVNKVFT